ncbi:hypothetical protein K437DRAFT_255543 [Tilletiaria anomala UBC 951]|uniref:Prolyl endopeptidase n=1 Tax=Tilletiaria anomala (strain ATCC 24038 / CBS 436.72 / UBC 951) TaxID=1037660 RepID=A0A066W7C9_TILAU|nr:uncharacterized protein K437DRAFT_255543 [Tilletiaria anomala UBC 951]KDN48433.1 hypothetical protein K437DRAFT_255543 [Tilletiaria anomala UBC 951]
MASPAPGWDLKARPFPQARRDDQASKTYTSANKGSVTVPEPYVWLETPPSQSLETKKWVQEQADFTQAYIRQNPEREAFKEKVEQNFSYPRINIPVKKKNGKFYLHYNSGLDPQSTIYEATQEEIDAIEKSDGSKPPGRVWFDANLLSKEGTIALTNTRFSTSGKLVAYGISVSGSDWETIYFRQTSSPFVAGEDKESAYSPSGGPDRLEDSLEYCKFTSATWTPDDKGVFYQTYPKPSISEAANDFSKGTETDANLNARLWYHRLGTKQSQDILVIDKDPKTPTAGWGTHVTEDGKYLVVSSYKDTDTKNKIWVAQLEGQQIGEALKYVAVAGEYKFSLDYVAHDGSRFYWITNKDATNSKVVYSDLDFSQARSAKHISELDTSAPLHDLIPEQADATLADATVVAGDKLLVNYTRDVKSELWQYELKSGQQVKRLLPDFVGTIGGISGRREDQEAFVSTTSETSPGSTYRFTWTSAASSSAPTETPFERTWLTTKVASIRSEDYISEQIFFHSTDGTRVPMFVTRHKDTKMDSTAPALLYAYGGFNISIQPGFSPWMMTWITEYGGVLAKVNARGGGEYGQKWHNAGRLLNKKNVFEDILSAAKFLHENKYAEKGKIIINGGSNGGLMVGACMNMLTEEHGIGAGIGEVGVMDMLKFHTWTIGSAWIADYGNPDEDPKIFDYNYSYSPLHNVQEGKIYPTYLLACADHDDRVVPAHTFKLTAELQHKLKDNPNPILLRVDMNAGHGAGKSIQKRIEEVADRVAVVGLALGLKMRGRE